MTEKDEKGQTKMNELLRYKDSSIFNEWERAFLRGLVKRKYSGLNPSEKAVITRLWSFFRGA